jgi:hypothetical protein
VDRLREIGTGIVSRRVSNYGGKDTMRRVLRELFLTLFRPGRTSPTEKKTPLLSLPAHIEIRPLASSLFAICKFCNSHDSIEYPIAEMDMDFFVDQFVQKHLHDIDETIKNLERELANLKKLVEFHGTSSL